MTTDSLQRLADRLREASEAADDPETSEKLTSLVNAVQSYAAGEREPTADRLTAHERELSEIASRKGGVVANRISDGLTHLRAHREMHGEA